MFNACLTNTRKRGRNQCVHVYGSKDTDANGVYAFMEEFGFGNLVGWLVG